MPRFARKRAFALPAKLEYATTSWWWGTVVPTVTGIYNPDANTWELFPSIVLTPPWTDKYFLNLQYIGILSNDKFSAYAGGVFKGNF